MLSQLYFIIGLLIILPSFCYGNADTKKPDDSSKNIIIEDIIQKVTNLTLNTMSKVPVKDKPKVLKRLEIKLKQLSKSLKLDKKYIDLILSGIHVTALNILEEKNPKIIRTVQRSRSLKANKQPFVFSLSNSSRDTSRSKEELAKGIAKNIDLLMSEYLKLVSSPADKIDILEKLRNKILDSAYLNQITNLPRVKSMMKKTTISVDLRRKQLDEDIENLIQEADDPSQAHDRTDVMDTFSKSDKINVPNCSDVVESTCISVKEMKNFKCYNGKIVPILKLCDGEPDCADRSDEVNCHVKVMEKVTIARHAISEVNSTLAYRCFSGDVPNYFMASETNALSQALQSQMSFLEQFANTDLSTTITSDDMKMTYNDVAILLSTLSMALDNSICIPHAKKSKTSDFNSEDFVKEPSEVFLSKSCTCKGPLCDSPNCVNNGNPCKRICLQRYNLRTWGCQASNGGTGITLDEICDGKLDCFDGIDEMNCVSGSQHARLEAIHTYNMVLEIILDKTKLKEYEMIRNNLLILYDSVKEILKSAIKPSVDFHVIKEQRDQIFNTLAEIFEKMLQKASLPEINRTYKFLILLNQKLVEAMKRSHTGNQALFPPNECFCKGGHCTLRRCTKKCMRTCLVEPKLTMFTCTGTKSNISVALNAICNDNKDCPDGEDEKECMKDTICRPHHYIVLRHDLREIGENRKGTALGEVLIAWKIKATAALLVAESNQRITPMVFTEEVSSLLKDLVQAYAGMEEQKQPHGDYVLTEFEKIATVVMKALKSCRK